MAEVAFESWAVVELLGHVKMAGRVTEEERFGSKLGRIDVPTKDGGFTTVYFGAGSVYRLTACTEEVARLIAKGNQPEPVHPWQLPAPSSSNLSRSSVLVPDNEDDEREDDNDYRDDSRDLEL